MPAVLSDVSFVSRVSGEAIPLARLYDLPIRACWSVSFDGLLRQQPCRREWLRNFLGAAYPFTSGHE